MKTLRKMVNPNLVWIGLLTILPVLGQQMRKRAPDPSFASLPEGVTADLLFRPNDQVELKRGINLPLRESLEEMAIQVNLDAVLKDPAHLQFSLFDEGSFTAWRKRSTLRSDGSITWYGEIAAAESAFDGFISLSVFQGRVSAVIHAGPYHYSILPDGMDGSRLVRLDHTQSSGCSFDTTVTPKVLAPTESLKAPPGGLETRTATVTIDIMTLYTADFTVDAATEMQAQNYINTVFDLANDVFANSKTPDGKFQIRYNLVHMGPISLTEADLEGFHPVIPPEWDHPTIHALEWMNEETQELTNLRNQHGADMVALFIPMQPTFPCGVATLPELSDTVPGEVMRRYIPQFGYESFNQRAYVAVQVGCGEADFTFAHEFGHTFGMDHDPDTTVGGNFLYDYGKGYLFDVPDPEGGTETVATVMGCVLPFTGGGPGERACTRIPHFSNPNVTYLGEDTGLPGTNGANNQMVAELRARMYAGFRPSGGDGPPTVQITGPANGVTVVVGDSVTLTGTATDTEDGNITSLIQWDSNLEPISGSGSPVVTTLDVVGDHTISAMVTDSVGNTTTASIIVHVVPEGPCSDDTQPPTGSITYPAHGASLNEGVITVTATATDNVGVFAVSLEVDGSVPPGLTDLSPPYSFNWNATPGTHNLRLRLWDVCDNSSFSPSITVTVVDDAPSTVPVFLGSFANQNLNNLEINITNPALNFSWQHASHPSGIERYQIVVQPLGGPWEYHPHILYPATSRTIQTSGLIFGKSYSYHIRAKSNAGAWGPFIIGGTFHVVEPPPVLVTLVRDNFTGVIPGNLLNGRSPEVGNVNWIGNSKTIFGNQNNVTSISANHPIGNLPFNPASHGNVPALVKAKVNPQGSTWVAIGFAEHAVWGWWVDGQVWVYLTPAGKYRVLANGTNQSVTTALNIPNFNANGYNDVTLRYDPVSRKVALWLNGTQVLQPTVIPGGYAPVINYAGWSALQGTQNQSKLDNFELIIEQ